METSSDWDQQKGLINELTQGMELAKQLQVHLNVTSSSHETRELLVHKILNSYDKALSMLKWNGPILGDQPQPSGTIGIPIGRSESPCSLSGSPHSEDSDLEFRDHEHKNGSRKRKSVPRWTKQVQVCPGIGLEGPLDDGFSWRKYGQKDIHGAKYPRGYYRCTHRNVQGCLATKQVQRSDEDPMIFEITYRGRHTCTPTSPLALPPSASPENLQPNTPLDIHHQQAINHPQQSQQHSQKTLLNFQTGLKVITQGLDTGNQNNQSIPSFYFPSTSHVKAEETYVQSHSMRNSNFMGNFSAPFMSHAASTSNYFPVSSLPNHATSFGRNQNLQGLESELTEIVPAAKSTTNSPTVGLDFPFGGVDQFEPTFSFDNPGFFS